MSAYRVIDKMETVVREGVWMPFGWKALNAELMLDLIEKLRGTLPDEAKGQRATPEAPGPQTPQSRDLRAASTPGPEAVRAGVADARSQEAEIIARAQSRAQTLVEEAQAAARDIRRGADEYADQVLANLDASLGKALAAVHKGRQQLASTATSNGATTAETSSR
jgi:vacuolar-type H+-ATPase subunit H